ncbi:MAG: hypothetical protein ACOC1I_08020 [Spirochaetota bacterium]
MLSQHSSRIVSRKSPRNSVGILLLILASTLVAPATLSGEIAHDTTVRTRPDHLSISISVSGAEPQELLTNLHDGLTARLEYAIRFLERRMAPVSLLGPRFVREFRVIYEIRWDPFRRRYTAVSQDGAGYTFRDEAGLWSFIFWLSDFRIPWEALATDGADELDVETRVLYDPIVFVPGLSILSVFLATSREQSPWSAQAIEVPR